MFGRGSSRADEPSGIPLSSLIDPGLKEGTLANTCTGWALERVSAW